MSGRIKVAMEATPDEVVRHRDRWPGWSRSGKTPELAIEALAGYAARYATVAKEAGEVQVLADDPDFPFS